MYLLYETPAPMRVRFCSLPSSVRAHIAEVLPDHTQTFSHNFVAVYGAKCENTCGQVGEMSMFPWQQKIEYSLVL